MDELKFRELALFSLLPPEEIDFLINSSRTAVYSSGAILFSEGDSSDRFSLVLEGQLEVYKRLGDGLERRLAVLGRNDFLGEMSLFFQTRRRSANARALTSLSVLEIQNDDFEKLLKRQPELLYAILQVTVQRMRGTENATIQDLQVKNSQLEQAYQELKIAQAQLLAQERLETELALARRIQQALLPKDLPELDGWRMDALWQPAFEVSGDFYDFIPLSDGTLGLVIGDVTGKGMPAALVMATTRSVLRSVIFSQTWTGFPSPGILLGKVNDILCPDMPSNMFVTCLLAFLDPISGRLLYANAGHNPPYLRTSTGVTALRARGMPLGLLTEMRYEELETILHVGDSLLAYSDGIVEAHDPQGEMFDDPRLMRLLAYPPDAPPLHGGELITSLMKELARFTGSGWVPEDDVTLVTVQRC
jgi:serine phosphatase RsbU (regulator of sigma subunit)